MVDGIEYRFAQPEDRRRRASLEVDVPADFFRDVLLAGRVAAELTYPAGETIIERRGGAEGRITLGFLHTGMVGPWEGRLRDVLGLVSDIDIAAAVHDVSDPRIHTFGAYSEGNPWAVDEAGRGSHFGFSFQKPEGSREVVLEKLRTGMTNAATMQVNNSKGHISRKDAAKTVTVKRSNNFGLELIVDGEKAQSMLRERVALDTGRIAVGSVEYGSPYYNAQGYAITFAGVVAALDPIER